MADRSKIEWTDATWNPIRGCSRVSEGCRNCYAERIAARFSDPGQPYAGLAQFVEHRPQGNAGNKFPQRTVTESRWTGEVRFIPELLEQPLHWRRPRRIFVNSMSDLFHEKVQNDWLDQIFRVMSKCPHHTFQILTKRASRMPNYFYSAERFWPLPNVWLGVSVEDQQTANERIRLLLQTPAAVRWVSYEPALGPVDFSKWLSSTGTINPETMQWESDKRGRLERDLPGLDWLVAGGESGPGARPADPWWFRDVRDQCRLARVSFFFKQWGEWLHVSQMNGAFSNEELDRLSFKTVCRDTGKGDLYFRVGKKRAGGLLDGIPWREFPKTSGMMP